MFCFDFWAILISNAKPANWVLKVGDIDVTHNGMSIGDGLRFYRAKYVSATEQRKKKKATTKYLPVTR